MATANTRATDSDRNDICQVLDTALSEGQLSTEEHRQRVSAATSAATLGDLQALVADLQIHRAPVQLPTLKSPAGGWGIRIAIATVLVLLAAGIAWGIWGSGPSRPIGTSTPAAQSSTRTAASTSTTTTKAPPQQLLTLGGLTGFLAQIRTKFGDTMGYQLIVHTDSAEFYRPDSANPKKVKLWIYSKTGWMDNGSWSIPPDLVNDDDTAVGDLSKFDVQAIMGVIRGAPQSIHVSDPTNTYMVISSAKNGSLGLTIFVSDDTPHGGGYMNVAADGKVLRTVTSDS